MDSKRPDVQLDDSPDEEGIVTKREQGGSSRSLVEKLREFFRR
ncbi:hypothetical protein [Natrinema salifodinae]|uniref:Uncharacterized protein n=1 Tax=Natrinema salifodinae TaxID=1202768 RepID=A0A1I0LZU3_9EURY|nr:hypothetical protein [Natrinema salifodinae]SEV80623.1 hypothetical protein SAMN05216285_0134 [Natrinema salifodinae]